jgi:tetratricopeptide (TPR) repeat protein
MDKLSGQAQLALGVGGLLLSGPLAGVAFLLAGLAVGAVGKAWDDSPAGQDGALARAARAVAAVSVDAPVVVIIDDADDVNEGLAVTLVDNLTARHNSQVLIVAAVNPGSAVAAALRARARYGLTDRLVYVAEADPDMGYESRLELARQLSTHLPDVATRRIAQRTTTFGEVFTVAAAPRLAELGHEADEALLAVVDAAVDARLARPVPSREAVVIAWAGGVVHARQADRALGILGAARVDDDPDVRRWESLERLADSADPRLADQVVVDLRAADRRALATAFLGEALSIARTAGTSLVDKVAALQAVHRVRADLAGRGQLPRAQCELVAALEVLGDAAAALQVATEAQSEWTAGKKHRRERDRLAAAVIRLSRLTPDAAPGPLAEQLIAEAVAGGAVVGLEARIWAAIVLLDTADQRSAALALAEKITGDIEGRPGLGTAGDRWRLLLGYPVGRAGQPALTTRLLAPLITSSDPEVQKEARMVRRAVDRPGADIRLQNILLEAELDTLPLGADDDRLRIHHALSENYADLGDYRQAAAHGQQELELRTSIHGARHPGTLVIRHNVADWIGWSGDAAGALRLFRGLLRDHEQVLGPLHPGTLATRAGIASWTGACGDAEEALRLYQKLLPVQEDVLGRRHPDSLKTRHNIAYWTRSCDDPATALCLYQDLLPEREDVIGPRHPDTLATRHEIAGATGDNGNPEKALRLYRELLPDREDVIGPRHPDTLATRNNIAVQIGNCGHPEEALRLFSDLLPDQQWVVGTRQRRLLDRRVRECAGGAAPVPGAAA